MENTVNYKGFKVHENDIDWLKDHLDNFKYAYVDSGSVCVVSESGKDSRKGLVLYKENGVVGIMFGFETDHSPEVDSLTVDWETLLKNHVEDHEDIWELC